MDADYERIIVHEGYDSNSKFKYHDIALVRLALDVTFTQFIKPICLPRKSYDLSTGLVPNYKLTVAGWGETNLCNLISVSV